MEHQVSTHLFYHHLSTRYLVNQLLLVIIQCHYLSIFLVHNSSNVKFLFKKLISCLFHVIQLILDFRNLIPFFFELTAENLIFFFKLIAMGSVTLKRVSHHSVFLYVFLFDAFLHLVLHLNHLFFLVNNLCF